MGLGEPYSVQRVVVVCFRASLPNPWNRRRRIRASPVPGSPLSPPRSVVPAQAIFWKRDLHFLPAQRLFRIPDTTLLFAVVSPAKASGALSMKRRFQGRTESGRMPYALAICAGVLSPAKTSTTTCAFSLDVYLRLADSTSFAPARPYPEQPPLPEVNSTIVGRSRFGVISPG